MAVSQKNSTRAMQFYNLKNSGIKISSMIMGTWLAGKAMWAGIDDRETGRAIREAAELGITTFDTAEEYGKGHSERMLGKALRDIRTQVILATKVSPNHLTTRQVIDACHRSLKNLGTDYIDLYQIHWPPGSFGNKTVSLEETMNGLNVLKKQGLIRAIGVSNFNLFQLEEARKYAPIDTLQPPYSLFWRHIENEIMPYCRTHGIKILAYSPMAQGLLTGKFGPNHQFERGDHRFKNRLFHPNLFEHVQNALSMLRPLAEKRGLFVGQLALAWVLSHQGTCAIAGARNADQIRQNIEAVGVILSEKDLSELDRIGRLVTDCLDDDPIMWK